MGSSCAAQGTQLLYRAQDVRVLRIFAENQLGFAGGYLPAASHFLISSQILYF